jgi:Hpt domain
MESAEDRSIGIPGKDAGWPVDLLWLVWSEQQHLFAERIEVIERATSALEEDRLGEQLRAEAQRAAHMLAGSIGIFGFQDASEAAGDLELELAQPAPKRAPTVRKLLSRLPRTDRNPLALRMSD